MSLNNTPSSERVHIGLFGRRNSGKSSLINAMTGQELSIVSDIAGTTTDPVLKSMELLPLGPVVIIDTPGLDDIGDLGELRVRKSYQMLNKTDIALLVLDSSVPLTKEDTLILKKIQDKKIPYLVVKNKMDLPSCEELDLQLSKLNLTDQDIMEVSAQKKMGIHALNERITGLVPKEDPRKKIVGDLLHPDDLVVLVVPIDSSAPKGRLILPQQQTIRDILDSGAVSVISGVDNLPKTLSSLGKEPALVITDSQAFGKVAKLVPSNLPLTSFSILFARYKGSLQITVNGAKALDSVKEGDRILISEGCTHHRQCEDIGTVKLPTWIRDYTGVEPEFCFTSGGDFPLDLSSYKMIIHCGGCTLNEREMKFRLKCAMDQNIPMTNYGIAIAYINGILKRSISPLGLE